MWPHQVSQRTVIFTLLGFVRSRGTSLSGAALDTDGSALGEGLILAPGLEWPKSHEASEAAGTAKKLGPEIGPRLHRTQANQLVATEPAVGGRLISGSSVARA